MTCILHLSDPHFGAADPAVAAAFLERAAGLSPRATILSGDLTMRARRSELLAARGFVDQLPRPYLLIPGNHDIPALNHPIDRFFRPFRRYRGTFGAELEPELLDHDIHVVAVNSSRAFGFHSDWSEGRLSADSLRTLDERFAARDAGLKVLVLHHPLMAPPDHDRALVKPLPELLARIAGQRVDLVLCGHFHRSHLAVLPAGPAWRCTVSQAATVCSTRLQGEPQGFHEIRWSGDHLEIVRHRHVSGNFVETDIFNFLRGPTGWQAADSPTLHECQRNP